MQEKAKGGATIDAHHHLWRYSALEYEWIDDTMAELRHDFLIDDLDRELAAARVDGTVVVQARQSEEETQWLLALARETPHLLGVVGWAEIAAGDFERQLEQLAQQRLLVGLRHVVQAEPDGFLDDEAFNRGIRAMRGKGLAYDILIYERQLEETTRFVDRHPEQMFVLDHLAKPRIAAGELQPWRERITAMAQRQNVCCKISGMVTEANPKSWTREQLRPYLDTVVEAFGPERLMAGTDWPVCLVGTSYSGWWEILRGYFSDFSEEERATIFGGCAVKTYRLKIEIN